MNETADAPKVESAPVPPAPPQPEPASSPTGGVFLQFIVFPLAIVLVAVTITGFFTWMSQDRRSYDEYLNEIQNGWAAKRGQSAYELSFRIADPEDDLRRQADFSKTLALFETSKKEPEVRRCLAVVLGHLGNVE